MDLISKYNIPVPRYTSYPTVPHWKNNLLEEHWNELVKRTFTLTNNTEGISLYIHLPFCESLCTYCACNTRITVNHKVEEPYITAVLKEWGLYLKLFGERPKIKEIHLGGGTPTFFSAQNLTKLIKGILERSEVCSVRDFSFEAHPSNTTPLHLQSLYDLGFRRVSFGIQDFDIKVQETINRYQTFEEVKTVVEEARKIGYISVNFDLVYGLPFQTVASLNETLVKALSLKPERIAFYSYAHVPWLKPGQRKYTEKDLPKDDEKRQLYETGRELFLNNHYIEIGMDHFSTQNDDLFLSAQNGTLHRNFMGYTPNHTSLLIGLGVSAISDSWTGFSQNIKTVEEYQARLTENKLPIFKGHALSNEDLKLRKHILNLMCYGKTGISKEDVNDPIFERGLKRLNLMQQDGLVSISDQAIEVNEKGKMFLRNICSCFDDYYWKERSESKLFSTSI